MNKGVSIEPGAMALMRIPFEANSFAIKPEGWRPIY